MMLKLKSCRLSLITFMILSVHFGCSPKLRVNKEISKAADQTSFMLDEIERTSEGRSDLLVSPRTQENGKLVMVRSGDWTSGFFPGVLWYLYEQTGDAKWKQPAELFTAKLEKEQDNRRTHDLGFMMYCSFGNGYRLTHDLAYKNILIQSAKSLITRYNPKVGLIRSWDSNPDKWKYPVIIDNMMNLELLFNVTKMTGDSTFYKVAVSHADHTMKNHFRSDFSSYHVIDYDPETGDVRKRNTHQGYADESAWARGQAWGLYGYVICYRETGDEKYLKQAENIADFILSNPSLPSDMIPYWDYNAPKIPNEPRDASAAAITASALYELANYSKAAAYKKQADKILTSLVKHYQAPEKTNSGFLLLHSTGHLPKNSEIDVPINYADYYYLEALIRSKAK